jgi:hypothetical protein
MDDTQLTKSLSHFAVKSRPVKSVRTELSVPVGTVPGMPLRNDEREGFLAEPHVAAISIAGEPGRGPLTVPIWYQYTPGGEAWVLTGVGSRKARLIEAAGRFTLLVQRLEPSVRYVSVEGPVTRTAPETEELASEMAHRYLPPDKAAGYLEFAKKNLVEHFAVYMRPEHWVSADLGGW